MAGNEIIVSRDIINRTSKIWVRKHLNFFRLFDTEKKGYFCKEESDARLGPIGAELFDEDELPALAAISKGLFDLNFGDIAVSSGGRTIVMWHDYIEKQACLAHQMVPAHEKTFRELMYMFFEASDKDKDGVVSIEEANRMSMGFGLTRHNSIINSTTIDRHTNSAITKEAFVDHWFKFFYGVHFDVTTSAMGILDNAVIKVNERDSIKWRVRVPEEVLSEMDDLWVRKMLTFFRQYDEEGTGRVDKPTMTKLAVKRSQNKISPAKEKEIEEVKEAFWALFWEPAVDKKTEPAEVTWANFLQSRFEAVKNRATEETRLKDFHETSFNAIDVNQDGVIQLEEHLLIASIRGLTRHQAVVSFVTIDSNDDGTISVAESLEAWRLFLYSKEWDLGTFLYGSPIDTQID